MAPKKIIGILTVVGVIVFLLIDARCQEMGSEMVDSTEDNSKSLASVVQPPSSSKRRPGGVIKYKKMSVKSKSKEGETASSTAVDVLETRQQNKTRRLKPKSSSRHTMIYKPSKKKTSNLSADKSEPTATQPPLPPSPEVSEEPSSTRSYTTATKSSPPEDPVTQSINTFVRPTKRIRIRPYETPTTTTTRTPQRSTVTVDPFRPINRYRSTTTTSTTTQTPPTTTRFIRLSRRPNASRNKPFYDRNVEQGESASLPESSTSSKSAQSSTVDPPVKSMDAEQLEEESLIRSVSARPDFIHQWKDSNQGNAVRIRLHLPKKPVGIETVVEPPTPPQANEQQKENVWKPEESQQYPPSDPESKAKEEVEEGSQSEETEKRIEKYEAEKMKQLERLRQNKYPSSTAPAQAPAPAQLEEDQLPKARRIPSSNEYRKTPVEPKPVQQTEEESFDFIKIPPSNFGQRLPTPQQREPTQLDPRPTYDIVYPSNQPEPTTSLDRPEPPNPSNPDVYRRPEVPVQSSSNDPESTPELYRRPDLIYNTAPRPSYIPDQYRRPEVTISRPVESERIPSPEVIYQSTPRPNVNEQEHYSRPEVIFVPPKYEYQPPSAYLSSQSSYPSYPRVRIAYYPAPTTIPPPSVTYEPPHLEYMPPSPSPPPRIYVPPTEEFKPPSTTATANAVQIVRRPNELRNGSPIVNYRAIDGPRVVEGVRQFETINSYARLVSVGHPAVNELPYPPVREGQVSGSSRPLQQTEPIVVRVPENHSASNQQQQQQYGEQEKLYWIAAAAVGSEPSRLPNQQSSEKYRGQYYDGSTYSNNGGHRTIPIDKVRTIENIQTVSNGYSPESSGQRVPDQQEPSSHYQQPHSTQISYQETAVSKLNQQPHPPASERPHYENAIPVSEQPYQKPYIPSSEGSSAAKFEKTLTENERPVYAFDKPITVTVRPHGIPSFESERNVNQQVKPADLSPLAINQEQLLRSEYVIDPSYRYHQGQSLVRDPSPFYPIGPVRAYQVTQSIYSTPPPRFFQLPPPLSNPFESKYQLAPSPPSPPTPPTPPPPAPISNSFEANRFSYGESWSVDPLLPNHYPLSISTSRPFLSSTLPPLPEEPQSSERLVRYRPAASDYVENQRLNRSLNNLFQTYQQQPPLPYDNAVVFKENSNHHQFDNNPQDDHQQPEGELTGVKGVPGVDYPILGSIPNHLKFKCEMVDTPDTRHPAYYADPYTRCQVFHVCQSTRAKDSFLCPNGTIFNQKVRVCDWWHNVQCEESAAFYNVNTDLDNQYYQQHQQQLLIL